MDIFEFMIEEGLIIDHICKSLQCAFELKKKIIKLHQVIMNLILINNEYKRQIVS